MDRAIITDRETFSEARVGHFIAAVVAVSTLFAVFVAAVVCIGQAGRLPLLTEDLTWLLFDLA